MSVCERQQHPLHTQCPSALGRATREAHIRPAIGSARHLDVAPADAARRLASLERLVDGLFGSQAHRHVCRDIGSALAVGPLRRREEAFQHASALVFQDRTHPRDLHQVHADPDGAHGRRTSPRSRGARRAIAERERNRRAPAPATAAPRRAEPRGRIPARATVASVPALRAPGSSAAPPRPPPPRGRATPPRAVARHRAALLATQRAAPCPARSPPARGRRPPPARRARRRTAPRPSPGARRPPASRAWTAGGGASGAAASAPAGRPARSSRPAPRSVAPPRVAPPAPRRRATPGGSPRRAPARGPRAWPRPAPPPRARARVWPGLPECRRSAPRVRPRAAAPPRAPATEPARARAAASGSSPCSRLLLRDAGGPAGAGLVRRHEMRERLGEEVVAGQARRRDGALDLDRLALDLQQHVHRGIPLDSEDRLPQPVNLHRAVDPQRDREPQVLEHSDDRIGIADPRFDLGTVPVMPALRAWPLPAQHPERGRAVAGPEDAHPQHLVSRFQLAPPVEAPIEHRAAKLETRAGTLERALQRRGVVDPRLDFQLVGGSGADRNHAAKMASSTAAVFARSENTRAAPAARSAATS